VKLWKIMYAEGGALGLAVVRAETSGIAIEMAKEYAAKEGLMQAWIDQAEIKECREGDGVLAWGEA
jgi:hypothetical protein